MDQDMDGIELQAAEKFRIKILSYLHQGVDFLGYDHKCRNMGFAFGDQVECQIEQVLLKSTTLDGRKVFDTVAQSFLQ